MSIKEEEVKRLVVKKENFERLCGIMNEKLKNKKLLEAKLINSQIEVSCYKKN